MVDVRAPEKSLTSFSNGLKPVKCLSLHPSKPYLLTSDYFMVKIWDIRTTKQVCIESLYHGKVAHGAFFSPLTGDKILTTCSDNNIRVFDSTEIGPDTVKLSMQARHDNQTGRWLAPFQAIWHPRNEEVFFVGSMDNIRKIDVYNSRQPHPALALLGNDSICCRNTYHPSYDVFAGTTSSGKAFIWR